MPFGEPANTLVLDDDHTTWGKAAGFMGTTNIKVEYIDFKGMNGVSLGRTNVRRRRDKGLDLRNSEHCWIPGLWRSTIRSTCK